MVPRADEITRTMARVLFIVVGVWAFSQVIVQAYQGAMRLIMAVLGS